MKKCMILHFGSRNQRDTFHLGANELSAASEEVDLGVCITDNLKPSRQCHLAYVAAQRILNLIRMSFHHLDIHTFSVLFKTWFVLVWSIASLHGLLISKRTFFFLRECSVEQQRFSPQSRTPLSRASHSFSPHELEYSQIASRSHNGLQNF